MNTITRSSLELERKVAELEAIKNLYQALSGSLDMTEVMEHVTTAIQKLFPRIIVSYAIAPLDPSIPADLLYIRVPATDTIGEVYIATIKEDLFLGLSTLPSVRETILQQWLKSDFRLDIRTTGTTALALEASPRSHVNVPLIIPGTLAVLINLSTPDEGSFDQETLQNIYVLLRGATETVRRMTTLRDREFHNLNQIIESIGDGVVVINPEWTITVWNRSATRITGWDKDEVLGKPFRNIMKLIRAEDRAENMGFIKEAMDLRRVTYMNNNTLLTTKSGVEIPLGDSAAPIFNPTGRLMGVIIVFRDISKEYELKKAREEFIALATHQLRTPITIIGGYSSMLLEQYPGSVLPQPVVEGLSRITTSNRQLLHLVNAMLNAMHIELGTLAIVPKPLQVNELIEETLREVAGIMENKHLTLTKSYGVIPEVLLDHQLVRAVIQNLLSNAIKYTNAGGSISVETRREDTSLIIQVSDTGHGIPLAQQGKIFTKMFRADNARLIDPDGSGLGLYIVKAIMEQSGGRIWFESTEHRGTVFFISIPLSGMKAKDGVRGLV